MDAKKISFRMIHSQFATKFSPQKIFGIKIRTPGPEVQSLEGEEKESCDEPVAVVKRFTFNFEANSPHEARCFFVGGNSDEASIVSFTGEEVAENGRFEPALVDRSLDGEYVCSLGAADQIIQIDVFRSEDDALVKAANDKPSQLTVATLDVDFSSELPFFGDYFGK
ncbi:unnamed protein product [Oikopleura dioica]|uniref:Uncharacterized protein n=1 Tax=Oikopleura dioica TaxID=34765 RepID=E4X3Q6_OIKDI|nr:unnamed protein product [Oikopleura dioica]